MPEVRLSISEVWAVSMLGSTRLLDLDCASLGPSPMEADGAESFSGDFRRTRTCFGASFRGCGGARVFFTTTGGMEWPRELIDESGLTLWEVPGRGPTDGALLGTAVRDEEFSDVTDPVLDARLRRLFV